MPPSPSALLRDLAAARLRFGPEPARLKAALLAALEGSLLGSPKAVRELHALLLFLRAFPDDAEVLGRAERMLAGFHRRRDLRRFRARLEGSGLAGVPARYPFYWFTARWLARRWPGRLKVDWARFSEGDALEELLPELLPYGHTLATDAYALGGREWTRRLKGPGETDAAFLINRFARLSGDDFARESRYEALDLPLALSPGADTPSRTGLRLPAARPAFQRGPLGPSPGPVRLDALEAPRSIRPAEGAEARRLIDFARGLMVSRDRDLDVFEHASPEDLRVADFGEGLRFLAVGAKPERRLPLEAFYGFVTLKNGVPLGYFGASALFGSSELAYNAFEEFRGAGQAGLYRKALGLIRALFGSSSFAADPYQLGEGNPEALRSGAFWFYHKLGFRPDDPRVRRVLREELRRLRRPGARSPLSSLKELARAYVFLEPGGRRPDALGRLELGEIGLRAAEALARRFGSELERGSAACSREAARLLGGGPGRDWSPGERLWWERWAPLALALPGVSRWPLAERRALARVIRAKGGRRESDYVRLAGRHRRLRRALLQLSKQA